MKNRNIAFVASILSILFFSTSFHVRGDEAIEEHDIVVYGGTSAAVISAVQAKKMGKSVIVVSPDKHLGGLTSGGLGYTDSGNTATVGGLSREFYQRVYQAYQLPENWRWQKDSEYTSQGQGTRAMVHEEKTMWTFEPHIAERIFDQWIKEMDVPVVRNAWLDRDKGVQKQGTTIVSITTLCGKTFKGKAFIDATYEGDLMATAGVDYHVGRESNDVYGETWNGNQVGILHHGHWFKSPVDPYVIPGDPSSGRLKYIDDSEPGRRGDGDHRVQAYCFRMCLTDHPENRVPFAKPEGYNPNDYELSARIYATGWDETFDKFDDIPNRKTDTNNHGPFSTDFIGMNYDYPEASYGRRREIIAEHEHYQKGLMYFLSNDERVPESVRERMNRWGLAKDEFVDNGHWPHQLYIREARRMIGEYVTTEHDCMASRRCPKPVGIGSYAIDSHNVRRYIKEDGFVQNEGDIGVSPRGPYGIDFGSLVPKQEQCTNLVVPVCVSSSHIAFGSIRMEPVFMILAQSAATAAAMAIDENIPVQQLDYEKLQERLVADGQRLEYLITGPYGVAQKSLPGYVLDDFDAELVGAWNGGGLARYVGIGYMHDANLDKGKMKATFRFENLTPGSYDVRLSYSPNANRASNTPVDIVAKNTSVRKKVNQKEKPPIDDLFVSLGTYEFGNTATVVVSNEDTDGHVIVDAVQLLERKP